MFRFMASGFLFDGHLKSLAFERLRFSGFRSMGSFRECFGFSTVEFGGLHGLGFPGPETPDLGFGVYCYVE